MLYHATATPPHNCFSIDIPTYACVYILIASLLEKRKRTWRLCPSIVSLRKRFDDRKLRLIRRLHLPVLLGVCNGVEVVVIQIANVFAQVSDVHFDRLDVPLEAFALVDGLHQVGVCFCCFADEIGAAFGEELGGKFGAQSGVGLVQIEQITQDAELEDAEHRGAGEVEVFSIQVWSSGALGVDVEAVEVVQVYSLAFLLQEGEEFLVTAETEVQAWDEIARGIFGLGTAQLIDFLEVLEALLYAS